MGTPFQRFDTFPEALAEKKHDFSVDVFKIALTNGANPPLAANSFLSDLTQVSYASFGPRTLTTVSSSQTGGTYKWVAADFTLTAVFAAPPFRYVVLYNDSAPLKDLVGYYDYSVNLTLLAGQTLIIDFSAADGTLKIRPAV